MTGSTPVVRVEIDREVIEGIAARVVELLKLAGPVAPRAAIDAAEVARRLGRSRGWVYAHAEELGASRPHSRKASSAVV